MLGPHHRIDAELEQVRRAPEGGLDAGVFGVAQAVLGDEGGDDGGRFGHVDRSDTCSH